MFELKPKACYKPSCGCNKVTLWTCRGAGTRITHYLVECDNCHTQGPAKKSRMAAIRAWNKLTYVDPLPRGYN